MRHKDVELEPGTYVLAVSGGVDSMVLLELLRQKPGLKLVIAHFDHGIRPDSHLDRQLVQDVALRHKLPFVHAAAKLGPETSEDTARKARYEFLHKVKQASGAKAIITAHHNDDLIETAIHNLLRGTGRKGLHSLSLDGINRPLMGFTKRDLQEYGKNQGLKWRDDTTNLDLTYRRNYIRHKIVPRLGKEGHAEFKSLIDRVHQLNRQADSGIAKLLQKLKRKGGLDRPGFIKLPHMVAREVMAAWLRNNDIRQFDKKTLERLVTAAKTYRAGRKADITSKFQLEIDKDVLKISSL